MDQAIKKCRIKGCKRAYRAKGYCGVHYKQWRQGKLPKPRFKTCSAEECHKKVHMHGLCEEHHQARASKSKKAAE
jgi:hypothetical protein